MSAPSPILAAAPQHNNRMRREFELREQRHMVPLLIVAALSAALIHVLAFRASPFLISLWRDNSTLFHAERAEQDEEAIRVVIRKTPPELQQIEPPPPEEQTMPTEEPPPEPQEIDILDIDVPELVMAPGETNIPLPEPKQVDDLSAEQAQMMPEAPAMNVPSPDLDPSLPEQIPEPTPLSTNSVIVNATPQLKQLDDAEGVIESELRRQASQGNGDLPSDTRSLAQLMGVSHLGANSGVARLGTDLLFAFNESRLKNSARVSLLQLAALIHKNPSTTFIIEGHTDGIGTPEYNAALSMRRAQAVVQWLAGNGVPIDRVFLRACGSSHPLVDTNLPRERQTLNRRVEIHMRRPGELMPPDCVSAEQ